MRNAIGFAIIGCGAISEVHAAAIVAVDGAALAGVFDRDAERAQAFARHHGCAQFSSLEQLLQSGNVDAVAICTPSGQHAGLAVAAALAGKHVAVEKPIATTLADAELVIAAQKTNNVKVTVISQLRFTPEVQALREAMAKGAFGRPVMNSLSMRYHRSPEYYQNGGWRGTRAMDGGGALMNQGIHGVDLLLHICGPVVSVYAKSGALVHDIETEDTVCAVLEFASGALGTLEASTAIMPGKPRRLDICGAQGSASLEENTIVQWDLPLARPVQRKNLAAGAANDPAAIDFEGHRLQYQNFIGAIRGEEELLVDAEEARRALALVLAVYRSAECGKPITL